MQLSQHFSLEELTATETGLANVPSPLEVGRLHDLADFMEKVRAAIGGKPINVDSAFRSAAVNEAVGGVPNSAHRLGYACDFTAEELTPLEVCTMLDAAAKAGHIAFDQLIQEGTWTHVSRDPRLRGQRLTKRGGAYIGGIHPT